MAAQPRPARSVLVTGASGYVGRLVVELLAAERTEGDKIVASDLRQAPAGERLAGVEYAALDVRDEAAVDALVAASAPEVVVHLAAIVTPPKGGEARQLAYDVDVRGTEHILEACKAHGVGKVIITSSGAAYGYHPDNPDYIREDAPLRGNEAFAYSHHKRLVEELLAQWRAHTPALRQLILRPGTILGPTANNQITAIFERPVILGLKGYATPFVFIWDRDVAQVIVAGIRDADLDGAFNLAGDGVMTLREIAKALHKPFLALPTEVVRKALALLDRLKLSPYGPEQVMFLQHRPVLANQRLKEVMGYRPKTTREAFEIWRRARA
ncbi:MAG: epimerase [Proteobacteria bacterium]|nr:MAG: epimerase [Pseudomonadota bacterium]